MMPHRGSVGLMVVLLLAALAAPWTANAQCAV